MDSRIKKKKNWTTFKSLLDNRSIAMKHHACYSNVFVTIFTAKDSNRDPQLYTLLIIS